MISLSGLVNESVAEATRVIAMTQFQLSINSCTRESETIASTAPLINITSEMELHAYIRTCAMNKILDWWMRLGLCMN